MAMFSSQFQVSEPPMDSSQSISGWESQDYPTSWEVQNPGPQTPQSQCQVTPNNVMRTFNGHHINLPAHQVTGFNECLQKSITDVMSIIS